MIFIDDLVPKGAACVGSLQGGLGSTTWSKLQESAGCEKHRTSRCGDTREAYLQLLDIRPPSIVSLTNIFRLKWLWCWCSILSQNWSLLGKGINHRIQPCWLAHISVLLFFVQRSIDHTKSHWSFNIWGRWTCHESPSRYIMKVLTRQTICVRQIFAQTTNVRATFVADFKSIL